MKSLTYAPAALLLAVAACERQEKSSVGATVTDSAGVRIVVNTGTAGIYSGWQLSAEPLMRVGWEEGDPTFVFLMDGFLRDDGSVAVSDGAANVIYVLEAGGELRYTLGGPGEGPGEFEHLDGILAAGGDTIIAQDGFNGGLSVFAGPDLVVDRRVDWAWRTGRSVAQLEARTDDGSLLMVPGYMVGGVSDPPSWNRAPVLRLSPDLESVDTIMLVDHFRSVPRRQQRNSVQYYGSATLSGDRIVHGRNDRAQVSWWDTDGRLVQIARWDHAFREADDEDWQALEEEYLRRRSDEIAAQPERFEAILADMKESFGGTVPAFFYALTDAAGNVWLADHSFVAEYPSHYSIVSASGHWLGGIEIPTRTYPLAITGSRFLGVEQNEWDVQAVVLYEVIKGD